jgi:hypothetical protein
MDNKRFSTRIHPAIFNEPMHLSIGTERPMLKLTEEAIQDLLKDKK